MSVFYASDTLRVSTRQMDIGGGTSRRVPMNQKDARGWTNVDAAGDASQYIDYLGLAPSSEKGHTYKRQTYELVGLGPHRRILDLGCGTGKDTIAMARQMGGSGEVVGVDLRETMVAEARRCAEGMGLPVRFEVANAVSLPFPDSSFDGCRADQVFQHLSDPEAALAEMVRVVRPGSPIVVTDPDYGSAVLDVHDRTVARKIQAFLSDMTANPWSGRRLSGMFRRAGLTDNLVRVIFWPFNLPELKEFHLLEALQMMQEQSLITAEEAKSFMAELESRAAEGTFFGGNCFFIVAGHKAI